MKIQILLMSLLFNYSIVSAQWQQLNGPFSVDIASVGAKGSTIFAGTLGEGLYVSYNNGQTWSLANGVPDYKYINAIAKSGQYIFAGDYRSTDNGLTWTIMGNGFPSCCITSLAASGATVLVGAYNSMGVRTSNDYGQTWNAPIGGLPSADNIYAVGINGTNFFTGVEVNGAYLSTNNGANWVAVNNGLTSMDVRNFAVCGTYIFASTFGGRFLSADNGANWVHVDNGLSATHEPIASFGNNLIAVDSGKVYISYNLGQNWTSMNQGLESTGAYSIAVDDPYLYVGTTSQGVWRRPLSELGLHENMKHTRFSIFPNPAVDKIIIQSQEQNLGAIISIYNIQGQLLLEQLLQQEKTELNLDILGEGLYILKLVYNDKTEVVKLIKE